MLKYCRSTQLKYLQLTVRADGSLERGPSTIAPVPIVSFVTRAVIEARTALASADTAFRNAVQSASGVTPQVLQLAVEKESPYATDEAVSVIGRRAYDEIRGEMKRSHGTWRFSHFVLQCSVDDDPGLFAIPLHRYGMPPIISEVVRGLHAHGKRSSASHVLEVYLVPIVYGHLDVISGSLAVDHHGVFDRSLEFEVDISAVADIKRRQIDGCIDDTECDYVFE